MSQDESHEYNDALEWAAEWITGAQMLGQSPEVIEFAKNMAMSIRAAKRLTEKERADRLEGMVDRMSETISECVLLIWPLYDLCQQIEICGASVELTKAVTMASDIMHKLMDATGQKQLPRKSV
jgi:hypothetical protein